MLMQLFLFFFNKSVENEVSENVRMLPEVRNGESLKTKLQTNPQTHKTCTEPTPSPQCLCEHMLLIWWDS